MDNKQCICKSFLTYSIICANFFKFYLYLLKKCPNFTVQQVEKVDVTCNPMGRDTSSLRWPPKTTVGQVWVCADDQLLEVKVVRTNSHVQFGSQLCLLRQQCNRDNCLEETTVRGGEVGT